MKFVTCARSTMTIVQKGRAVLLKNITIILFRTIKAIKVVINRTQIEMRQTSEEGSLRGIAKFFSVFLAMLLFFNSSFGFADLTFEAQQAEAASEIENWWPVRNARMEGLQPFKFIVPGRDVSEYDAFWQVGDGELNRMANNYETYPHKEAQVDLTGWTWNREGSYIITFVAKEKDGREIALKSIPIQIDNREEDLSQGRDESVKEGEEVADDNDRSRENGKESGDSSQNKLNVWWPVDQARLGGVQPFKADVSSLNENDYVMYWQVGGDRKNSMPTVQGHKETPVDLSGWSWRDDGKYNLTFIAEDRNGSEIAREDIEIYVSDSNSGGDTNGPVGDQEDDRSKEVSDAVISTGSLAGKKLYVNPSSSAQRQADEWRHSRPEDAKMMDIIASQPQAVWLGGWNNNIEGDVRAQVSAAQSVGATAVFVAYNIPHRDCGLYSAGGVSGINEYRNWIAGIARGLEGSGAVVILEPDALAGADCLSENLKAERKQMISEAIVTLKNAGAVVYVESSTPPWKSTEEMANRLREIGVHNADGFALNASSFTATEQSVQYGYEISDKLGGMHFIVDTSRSGRGQNEAMEWCNPWGRGLGERPTTNTGLDRVDAFLWVKSPGESDGNCNGGPNAGEWFPEYALDLARNRSF